MIKTTLALLAGGALGLGALMLLANLSNALAVLALTLFPGAAGTAAWSIGGVGLLPALSWTIPLTALLALANYLLPWPWGLVGTVAGLSWFATMLFSRTAGRWWFRFVLRQRDEGPGSNVG